MSESKVATDSRAAAVDDFVRVVYGDIEMALFGDGRFKAGFALAFRDDDRLFDPYPPPRRALPTNADAVKEDHPRRRAAVQNRHFIAVLIRF